MTALAEDQATDAAADGDRQHKGGSPTREYVLLEEVTFEDDDRVYYTIAKEVESRNGHNALSKGFKELRSERKAAGEPFDEATLVPISKGQWRPTPVKAKTKESVSVVVGG